MRNKFIRTCHNVGLLIDARRKKEYRFLNDTCVRNRARRRDSVKIFRNELDLGLDHRSRCFCLSRFFLLWSHSPLANRITHGHLAPFNFHRRYFTDRDIRGNGRKRRRRRKRKRRRGEKRVGRKEVHGVIFSSNSSIPRRITRNV